MRKILTILLSVVILITSISIGFVTLASDPTGYTVNEYGNSQTLDLSTLPSTNRLSGTPYFIDTNGSGSYKTVNYNNGNATTWLYNNSLSDTHGSGRNGMRFYNGLIKKDNATQATTDCRLVFDLGNVYDVKNFLVAGSSNQYPITSFEIYLSDDFETIFNSENMIANHTRTTAGNTAKDYQYLVTLNESTSGSFFGVKFTGIDTTTVVASADYTSIYLTEIGAYGSINTTVTSQDYLSGTSLNLNTKPVQIINQDGSSVSTETSSPTDGTAKSLAMWTDKKITASTSDAERNIYYLRMWNAKGMTIAYDLKSAYEISEVLLASGAPTRTDSSYVTKWEVYVANKLDDLYEPSNRYAYVENTTGSGLVINKASLKKHAIGQYVGIKLVDHSSTAAKPNAYISEISIMGTVPGTVEGSLSNNNVIGQNVLSIDSANTKTYVKQGVTGATLDDRTTKGGHDSSGSITKLYDNNYSSTLNFYNGYTDYSVATTYSKYEYNNMEIVFEASEQHEIGSVVVSSVAKGSSNTYALSYIVYVGTDKSTLFSTENIFAVCENKTNEPTTIITVDEEHYKKGNVFGILITKCYGSTRAYVSEIGFYKPFKTSGVATISTAGENLLVGKDFYKGSDTTVSTTPKTSSENYINVSSLTNGKFDDMADDTFNGRGLRFYNGTTANFVYDIGKTADISKVLIAGGLSHSKTNTMALKSYAIFVGDSTEQSTLFDFSNQVAFLYNVDNTQAHIFDFSSLEVTGQYIGVLMFDIYDHIKTDSTVDTAIYVTEFAVYGNWATDAYTVVNEPAENDLSANELSYATLSETVENANVLTDGKIYYTGAETGAAALLVEDADNVTFTYDLDALVSINSFLIGSKYDVNTNLTPAHYKIYVADTLEGLDSATAIVDYYPASYVADSGTYQGSVQQFVLKDAVQGRFVRFEFTKAALSNGDLNLTELGVYTNAEAVVTLSGSITAPVAVYTDGITAEFNAENGELKLAAAMSRGEHSLVVVDNDGNTEVYFLNKGAATRKEALDNAFDNKSATFADSTPYGIDFVVDVTDTAKAEADEIGIVIAKSQTLNGADLIADSDDYKNAKAVAYDGTVDYIDGNSFSATVHNFEQYKYLYRYAARAYMIVDGYVVYGVAFETTPAEAAQKIVDNANGYSAELVAYAQNIVDNSGLSEVALARAEFLKLESVKDESLDAAATLQNSVACNTSINLARLKGVIEKAQRGEDIVLATLGGSITQGFNANYNPITEDKYAFDRSTHCWSNLLREWLQNTFNVNVTLYNAGIGSTTSTVGVGRVVNDVFSHNPDLIVIDYAVNDSDSTSAASLTMTYAYEALTRRILSSGDDVALMMLFNVKQELTNKQEKYAAIGNHYGIPMISYRDAIAPLIEDGTYVWTNFSNDSIHPHAYGHQVIAALFGHYIAGIIENVDNITDTLTALPDYWNSETADDVKSLETATLYHSDTLPASWIEDFGSFEVSHNIHHQFPNGWLADYTVDNSNAPMVINVPSAKKLIFLVHNDGNGTTGTYASATLTFEGADGTSTQKLQTHSDGNYANEIIRYDSTTLGAVKVTITPQTDSTLTQFKLLGIIVCE